jgi:hypothetical protein
MVSTERFIIKDISLGVHEDIFRLKYIKGADGVALVFGTYQLAKEHTNTLGKGIYKIDKIIINTP